MQQQVEVWPQSKLWAAHKQVCTALSSLVLVQWGNDLLWATTSIAQGSLLLLQRRKEERREEPVLPRLESRFVEKIMKRFPVVEDFIAVVNDIVGSAVVASNHEEDKRAHPAWSCTLPRTTNTPRLPFLSLLSLLLLFHTLWLRFHIRPPLPKLRAHGCHISFFFFSHTIVYFPFDSRTKKQDSGFTQQDSRSIVSLSLSLSQKHNNLTEIVLERAPESRIRVSRVWCSHANHCTLHKFACAVFVSLTLNKTQGRFTLSLSLTKSWISVSRVWCSPEPLHFAQVGWCSLCELQRLYYYSAIYFYMHTFWHHPILQGVLDSSVVGTLLPVLYSCFGFFLSFLSCSKKLLKAPVVESVFWKDFEIYCNR